MLALARLIRLLTAIAVALIAAGILLFVLGANGHNAVVSDIHSAAKWVVGPFQNVFHIKGAKADLALNWGLALVIYAIVGGFLSRLLSRPMGRSAGYGRRVRPVV
jgi:hypothetical protein